MTKTNDTLSRIRFLTIALFLSGSFNILLLALLFYWTFQDKPTPTFVQLKAKTESSPSLNEELLRHLRMLPLESLIVKLQQTTGEERDLALAILVSFHDFDIKRALCSSLHPLASQVVITRNGEKILTFPHLKEEQTQLIQDFAKKERWPLKAKGLFVYLKQGKQPSSLAETFYATDEFLKIKRLFGSEISSESILQVLLEGTWEMMSYSFDSRPHLLYEYAKNGSSAAASLLLKTDWEFVIHRLRDEAVIIVFKSLKSKEELNRLASAIAASPRGESLRNFAQKILTQNNLAIQEKVLTKLKPKEVPTHVKKLLPIETTYIVQEGDSLWKIARKYQVDVESLKKYNTLTSDLLQPGIILKIPS